MPKPDMIVVGASAGGVEALQVLVSGLPLAFDAAVFVTLHIGAGASALDSILSRAGPLRAKRPGHGEHIKRGTIYVAPPDYHMLVAEGQIQLSHGPKESRTRPAINPMFRSAARSYGGRVAGVILSGALDDGVAGLAEIKRCGGIAVVQDPDTAQFPDMPSSAINHVDVDYVVPVLEIGALIARLTAMEHTAMEKQESLERKQVELACPECQGPIWEERQGRIVEYRCRVGHAFSPLSMLSGFREVVENRLWNIVVSLEATADVAEQLAPELGEQARSEAQHHRRRAAVIKQMLGDAVAGRMDS
jgi:two-component system chemotaxis response regulator CheB